MGKSRSATCVIAYLMQKHHISPQEALEQVRLSRPIVEPNDGFMQQLELYHKMQMTDNIEDHPAYHRWMYQREVALSSACGQAPDAEKIRFEDEHVGDTDEAVKSAEFDLRCKRCSRTLAKSNFLIPHKRPPHNGQFPTSLTCAHYFLDPLSWMRPELEQGNLDGRLECPKCKTNVGKYAWQGMRCSCGEWIVPGISLAKGKVDESRSRTGQQNQAALGIRRPPGVSSGASGPPKENL